MPTLTQGEPPFVIEIDYDDNLRPSALRVINTTEQSFEVELVQTDKHIQGAVAGRKVGARFHSGRTEIAIPTANPMKLQFELDGIGRLDGIDLRIY